MAKQQEVVSSQAELQEVAHPERQASGVAAATILGSGMIAAILIFAQHHPSDSVAVESGDAILFSLLALIAVCFWSLVRVVTRQFRPSQAESQNYGGQSLPGWGVTIGVALLTVWILIAAFATSPPGNLRLATNEAWVWIAVGGILFLARRTLCSARLRRCVLALLLGCAAGQSVLALHQHFVSIPKMQAMYDQNPDALIAMAGIDAPEGSAARVVFRNRLFDGGPTGTFALANSLAGVLVVGVAIALGTFGVRFRLSSVSERIIWVASLGLLVSALLMARSRSGLLAAFGAACVLMCLFLSTNLAARKRKTITRMALVLAVTGGLTALGITAFGKREWIATAHASVAYRLEYWKTTLAIALDNPWFGTGPGNFQMQYVKYRSEAANEQIAEPHNFFFETLATGGWVAAILLLVVMAGIAAQILSRQGEKKEEPKSMDESRSIDVQAVWLGGVASLFLVWVVGLFSGNVPDVDAHTFAVPIGIAAGSLGFRGLQSASSKELDNLCFATLVGLLVHLSTAGGWTVPGIAVIVVLLSGMLGRLAKRDEPKTVEYTSLFVSFCLLFTFVWMSFIPVTRTRTLMASVPMVSRQNGFRGVSRVLEEAALADRWSASATAWHADAYRWNMVAKSNLLPSDRTKWRELIEQTTQRAGDDSTTYREFGKQQMHLYQRFGEKSELLAAKASFEEAIRLNPNDVWMLCQLAEILRSLDEPSLSQADELVRRADAISKTESLMDRQLAYQLIFVAKYFGRSVIDDPQRKQASELLRDVDSP